METTAITLTSLTAEPATRTQAGSEATPGQFAKILETRPAQAEKPDGKPADGQEGEQPSADSREISALLIPLLPTLLPEGPSPAVENGLETLSSGPQVLGNNASAQPTPMAIPNAGTKSDLSAVVPQTGAEENLSSAMGKPFGLGGLPSEAALPDSSALEDSFSGKGTVDSLFREKARMHLGEVKSLQNPEGGESFLKDLNHFPKADPANFDSEIPAFAKGLFGKELKPAESSTPGHSGKGELFANLTASAEPGAGLRPAGETRIEGASGPQDPAKTGVSEQIGQKVVWSLGRQEERFRLSLDPPHLGSIYMEIQLDKEQVKATLWAENPNTKQVLEANQLSIQKIIETEGFSLESFNVFVEQDLSAFQESRERMMRDPDSRPSSRAVEIRDERGGGPATQPLFTRRSDGGFRAIDLII
jgi:flagellar hook-length control protein FliK